MDLSLERDSTAIGSLFQQIIADMKNTSPLWEDFVAKASKLHACLRAAIQAIAAYLDAFQKIADAATNSRGASKEIGTALTRVCLRHKAVETRMKTFTSAIMDCLIVPLQDKLEDWKRQVVTIDKEHAKEYKRCRTELKKRSSDTLRLQKKARKGQSDTIQSLVDSHMQDVSMRRAELEDVERKSLRSAMIEERMRYCNFVYMLQPVVKEECEVMSELGHLQEAMQSIAIVTKEPNILPQSSEELILDSKSSLNLYPESPGGGSGSQGCSNSLGSRKSSVCSISSMNSSGSSGSPGHHYQRSLSQLISPAIRLKPGESSDSGFCSSPALTSQASGTTSQSHAVSTWPPHSQDVVQTTDRPHTISSAYEKGHQRPALTVYTFQNPETIIESQKSPAGMACRPPLPVRCSSLERPMSAAGIRNPNVNIIQRQCPSPIPAHITKELPQLQPTYVNMSELASMAASKITNQQLQQQQQQSVQQQSQKQQQSQQLNSPNQSTTSSQISSDSSIGNSHHLHSLSDLSLTGTAALSTASTATLGVTTPPSIGDSPPLTSQNNLPQLTENTNSLETKLTGSGNTVTNIDDELKITETDSTLNIISNTTSSNSGILSPENDDISRASVLQKTSMFEKLEQKQQIVNNNLPTMTTARSSHIINTECNFANKKEEIYKCTGTNEKDPDQIYEDSIQELNNLIGELDSFQREHELKELANRTKLQNPLIIDNLQSTIDTDSISDKISIGSLNYSTQSTNASEIKFNYSDSEISRYVSESSSVGFENPTFLHFNNHNGSSSDLTGSKSNCNGTDLIGYDQNTIIVPSDFEYVRENSEIVVLRCKDPPTAADRNETESNDSKQRLSSFRSEQQSSSSFINTVDQQNQYNQEAGTINRDESNLSKNNLKYVENSLNVETTPTMDHLNRFHHIKTNLDERLRSKPTISPRPASLSGCVSRITRRSSINSIKPPPPVRRSSSVTPSHNLTTPNSPNLIQQNVMNSSVESLPPPPAFLLDRAGNASPTINVAETVKALTVIRHTPASPSALRRSQVQQNPPPTIQSHRTSNSTPPGIYAQPKQVSKMSSFRTPSPGPQKTSSSLLAQLNARLMPSKQNQQQQQQHHPPPPNEYSIYQQNTYQENNRNNQSMNAQHMYGSGPNSPHHQTYTQPEQIYSRADDRYYYAAQQQQHNQQQQQQHQQQQQQQHQQHCDDYSPSNIEKSGSMRSKSKAEFLENLNAKLAKQGLSGRAFAVRNLINSKALPDPRLCHESLMDQIKRGATLKRNRTINDRSAPKIH